MRTLSPSPLITSGNTLAADVGQYSALPSSPLVSQLICAKKKYSVECQTEDTHLKTKDELVGRISELTSRQAGLVDKIQELTRQLEDAKVELNRHKVEAVNVQALAKSSVIKSDSSIQTELKSSDKSLQTENVEDCVQCKILQEKTEKIISTIRTMEEGVLAAKENPQYPEFLVIKNRFTVLSEEEENHVPSHEIASSSTKNTLQLDPVTQQISATELTDERCQNMDVAAATGDCNRAPVEGRQGQRGIHRN
ncbi:hypothetical protein J6590_031587 [Homalodisca vitripennis]|nr:hypothetical protein J6590_031587 [Homalodisca vitripennis]